MNRLEQLEVLLVAVEEMRRCQRKFHATTHGNRDRVEWLQRSKTAEKRVDDLIREIGKQDREGRQGRLL